MGIPDELQAREQWVCWRRELRGERPTKVPINSRTGALAKTNDSSTWSGYDEALTGAARYKCDGVGFVFTREDPYAGVDLDQCLDGDGALGSTAQEIVDALDTYAEVSPSGRGLHCIVRGEVPVGARKQAVLAGQSIEVYSEGRFFCMTGSSITNGTPIRSAQPQLKELCQRLKAAASTQDNGSAKKLGAGEGRNNELTRRLGVEVAKGVTGGALRERAHLLNDFDPPLPDDEVERILRSAEKWPTGEGEPLVHEAAHAEVLKGAWLGRYRWAEHEGSWRRWTGHVWKKVGVPVVAAAAQKVLREHYGRALADRQSRAKDERLRALHKAACRYASVFAGLAFLKGEPGFYTEAAEWDVDPYLLNCNDGMLDMRTQVLRPHDPGALCTKVTRWSYADANSTGAWQRHLERCLPSVDVRRQVQRDLGRALVGADLEESLPIWYGTGANGKSTTERAVQRGVGGYGKKAVRNLLVASKHERHPTEVADLAGARLVFSEEVEDGRHLDEALVKDLTGGSRKKARFMRCDNFEFEQTFTIFLLVNHRPVISGTDRGIWRRIRLVPWSVAIPEGEQRPQEEVVADLVADGSWMLPWMVAGFADWQADPHWVAAEVRVATEEYRAEQDRLGGFLAEACEQKAFAQVSVGELHDAYGDWCTAASEEALGKIAFGKVLKSGGLAQKKVADGSRVWMGIRLRTATHGKNPGSPRENDFSGEEQEKLPVPAVEIENEEL